MVQKRGVLAPEGTTWTKPTIGTIWTNSTIKTTWTTIGMHQSPDPVSEGRVRANHRPAGAGWTNQKAAQWPGARCRGGQKVKM